MMHIYLQNNKIGEFAARMESAHCIVSDLEHRNECDLSLSFW